MVAPVVGGLRASSETRAKRPQWSAAVSNRNDPEYYAARERHARELAASAKEPQIKAIHLDMAERYAKLREDAAARH